MTTDELAHMESVDSKMSEIRRAQSEQRAADREAEKDRQGAAAVRAQEEEQFEQQMHDHKTRMYENLQRRKARRDVPPGRQAAAICSGEKTRSNTGLPWAPVPKTRTDASSASTAERCTSRHNRRPSGRRAARAGG